MYENQAQQFDPNADMAAQLAERLHLSPEQLETVRHEMQRTDLGFIEAAVNIGLMTREQAVELKRVLREQATPVAEVLSPVEAALRKASGRVRSGSPVKVSAPSAVTIGEVEPCKKLSIAHDPYAPRSEKIRALRTELVLRLGPTSLATTVAVMSPAKGDGRSLLTAELALALAQLGKPTLLVDADLRNPGQHMLFNCQSEQGLSTLLSDPGARVGVYSVAGHPQLHVLPAGTPPNNPLELLSASRFATMVNSWRSQYAYILFDTSPTAGYADALTVATVTSKVLLVTRAHQTMLKDAKEMMRRLSVTQAEILGSVLNHF